VVAGAQCPVVRVVGEDNAAGAELVDQGCCIGRAGHLGRTAIPAARIASRGGEEDADSGQVREDLILADVSVAGPAPGRVELV